MRTASLRAMATLAIFRPRRIVRWTYLLRHSGLVGDVARQAFVYWQYGVPYNSGLTGAQEIEVVVCMSFAVACWSWLAGFTLAALSGKTALINKTLFCLVWFCVCGPLGLLVYSARLVLNALGFVALPHAVGFSALAFFGAVHLSLATLFFMIPSLLGMRRARRILILRDRMRYFFPQPLLL